MKTFVPHYYNSFHCTAGNCKHTCCVGWEIDVDLDTIEKYNKLNTPFGEKIRANLTTSGDCNCFRLTKDEHCPFLNGDNLCDIILELGEDCLCDICKDHPRFRHFYSDCIEIGLGICCEEACRLILSDNEPFSIASNDGEIASFTYNEESFLAERNEIIATIEAFEDVFSAIEKINSLYELSMLNFDVTDCVSYFGSLEILDSAWTEKLYELKNSKIYKAEKSVQNAFLNLYKYFIFRHLSDGCFYGALAFSEISVKMIWEICVHSGFSLENICNTARMYSSEIEYSDENFDKTVNYALENRGKYD